MLPETTPIASMADSGVSASLVSTASATANAAARLVAHTVGGCIGVLIRGQSWRNLMTAEYLLSPMECGRIEIRFSRLCEELSPL